MFMLAGKDGAEWLLSWPLDTIPGLCVGCDCYSGGNCVVGLRLEV
jgi:hypothetical protein